VALHFWSSEKVIQYSRGFAGNDQAVTVEEKSNGKKVWLPIGIMSQQASWIFNKTPLH
jgi:hypothetical protein